MKATRHIQRSIELLQSYHFDRMRKLYLNVTARCNSNCRYCDTHQLDPREDLSLGAIIDLLDECRTLGLRKVQIAGGEPFQRQGIWEILTHLSDSPYDIIVDSNGISIRTFTDNQLDIISKSVSEFEISLDSPDEETHDYLRGRKSAFRDTVSGLQILSRLKHVRVVLFTVVTRYNFKDIPQLVHFTGELGFRNIWFLPLLVESNYPSVKGKEGKRELMIEENQYGDLEESIETGRKIARDLSIATNLSIIGKWIPYFFNSQRHGEMILHDERVIRKFRCVVPFESVYINHRGGVQPCAMIPELGNLSHSSLHRELEKMKPMKKALKQGRFPGYCQNCMCQFDTNFKFSILRSPISNRKQFIELIREVLTS